MSSLIQQFADALTLGCLYGLVAIGYTMIFGVLRLINFAHSDVFMMSMYFAFYSISFFYIPWYLAIFLIIIATAILGMTIERLAYRPLRKAPSIQVLTSAIGASYLLQNLATVLFTGIPKSFPNITYLQDIVFVSGIRFQRLFFFVIICMTCCILALIFFINKTKTGVAIRAVSNDFETAKLMGISLDRTIGATFAVGSGLAAVGAFFWGLKYPQIQPFVGAMPGIKCFIGAVLGGIGNIYGAVVGGMILGVLELMLVYFFPAISGFRDAIAFVLLILILMIRPTGLFGEKIVDKT